MRRKKSFADVKTALELSLEIYSELWKTNLAEKLERELAVCHGLARFEAKKSNATFARKRTGLPCKIL